MNPQIYQAIKGLNYRELLNLIDYYKQVVYSGDQPPEFYPEWQYYQILAQELDNRDII